MKVFNTLGIILAMLNIAQAYDLIKQKDTFGIVMSLLLAFCLLYSSLNERSEK
jgi:hypothetical protein